MGMMRGRLVEGDIAEDDGLLNDEPDYARVMTALHQASSASSRSTIHLDAVSAASISSRSATRIPLRIA